MEAKNYYIPDTLKNDIWEDQIVLPEEETNIFLKFKKWATGRIRRLFSNRH